VTGKSTERRSIVVMNLTGEPPAPSIVLGERAGRCRSRASIWRHRDEKLRVRRRWQEIEQRTGLCREGCLPAFLSTKPKEDETQIAVDRTRAGCVFQRHRADVMDERAALTRRVIDQPGAQTG